MQLFTYWTLWLRLCHWSLNRNDLETVTVNVSAFPFSWSFWSHVSRCSWFESTLLPLHTQNKHTKKPAGFNITVTVLPRGCCWMVWARPARRASNLLVKHDYMNQRCSVYNVQNETWKLTRVIWQHCSCVCSSLVKEKLAVRPRINPGKNRKTNSFSF